MTGFLIIFPKKKGKTLSHSLSFQSLGLKKRIKIYDVVRVNLCHKNQ